MRFGSNAQAGTGPNRAVTVFDPENGTENKEAARSLRHVVFI